MRRTGAQLAARFGAAVAKAACSAISPTNRRPPPANPLTEAKWIWHNEGNPAAARPVGTRYFRRTVVLDAAGRRIRTRGDDGRQHF